MNPVPKFNLKMISFQFLFLHLGREKTEREKWMDLVLSAFRDCTHLSQLEDFSLDNVQDIQSCWRFFAQGWWKESS